ncbi:MAG: DMT family transporter [Rickettsiales bacterium]|nr:DMT family transporter [Pseudomonadota bacterium]MDA0966263.1 DMT family transporter [Pseudomonadota bacterium]MDG4543072.1 DMT family transporter [Rickettsiales bacterium]MDG4545270.1 DMT family transporter [Rickettsiales bacterium]MDG4547719.1 DMT family transporter [Rickettsiales bacterium]
MKQQITGYLKSHSNDAQGILWMLYGCFWFACMASIVKYLTFDMEPFTLVFFRSLFALVCILPGLYGYGIHKIKSKNISFYFTRAITGTAGMVLIFVAIAKLPITTVTALTFTVPLITTAFAVIYLNEKLKKHNVIALLCGFFGVLIILRPGTETFQTASLLVIAAACFWSISNILIKKLTKTEDPKVIVYLMIIIMAPLSLPLALLKWQTPDTAQLLLLFLLAFVSNQAQFSLAHAYSKADMSTVLPFDYTRMIFISIMAYFFFGEIIDFYTAIGSIVIFFSGVYIVKHQRKKSPPIIDSGETLT